jgi:uncharacterized protein YkwD
MATTAPPFRIASPKARLAAALLLFLALAAAAFPPGTPAEGKRRASPADTVALERKAHELVNAHRRSRGLPPLAWDARIAEVARRHSRDMAEGRVPFGHEGFEARSEEIGRAIPLRGMAENVGLNDYPAPRTALAAVSGWIGSRGHRENIEGRYELTGVGMARDAGGAWYYTQIFVRRAGRASRRPS